jgi:hypothetical protein
MEARPRFKLSPKLLSISQCFSPTNCPPTSASSPDKSNASRSPCTSANKKFSPKPRTPKFKQGKVSYEQVKAKVETYRVPSAEKCSQDKNLTSSETKAILSSSQPEPSRSQEILSESGIDTDINKTIEITDHKLLADSIRRRAIMLEGLEKKITWNEKRRVKILQIDQEKYDQKKTIEHSHSQRLKEHYLRQQVVTRTSEVFRRESNLSIEELRESKSRQARNERLKTVDDMRRSRHSSVIKQKVLQDMKERNKREADELRASFVEFHKTLKQRDKEMKKEEAQERKYQASQDAQYKLKAAESHFRRAQSSLQVQLRLTSE